jgi:hypothetical protein
LAVLQDTRDLEKKRMLCRNIKADPAMRSIPIIDGDRTARIGNRWSIAAGEPEESFSAVLESRGGGGKNTLATVGPAKYF